MIYSTRRLFSRHTPRDLEGYETDNLTDKELRGLSEGEVDDLIDEDSDRASRNTGRYVSKKLPKYLATGATIGAGVGALASRRGRRIPGALVGSGLGAMTGVIGADTRGRSKAYEEGHTRREVSRRVAKRMDKVRGGNSWGRMKDRELRREQLRVDRDRNAALWTNAAL